jgi:hypothetical protein
VIGTGGHRRGLTSELARRAGVYHVKLVAVLGYKFERVSLDKFKRVMRLRLNVNPNNLKPGHIIAHTRAARFAKRV